MFLKGDASKNLRVFNASELDPLIAQAKSFQPLIQYSDTTLNELMHYFKPSIAKKSLAVIGTVRPWVEAIGILVGASPIVTLEYTRAKYDYPNMEWHHVNDYLDNAIENKVLEEFDTVASFSSLEHAGLGRYGDPINPNGDIEAVRQIHCMLKPGGLFFLGLPTSNDGSSYIEFNAHRIYGTVRLEVLFEGWRYLTTKNGGSGHSVFVLQKP
jgi:hypothetical protein